MKAYRFTATDKAAWNEFVLASKNGTFLFLREYMEYHADRFIDHSLLIRDDRERLVALLPATQQGETLSSHAGLTYGGIVSDDRMSASRMLRVFDTLSAYIRNRGLKRLVYKTVPAIYHRLPAEEDRYALFCIGARLSRRDVLSVLPRDGRLTFRKDRKHALATARRHGLLVKPSHDPGPFWALLEESLLRSHEVRPTHSVNEMRLLMDRFPNNIHLHVCLEDERIIAGEVIYDTGRVAHAQYGAASPRGKMIGAQDILLAELINIRYSDRKFFDFGSSNEAEGRVLNIGLASQKEGFGARTIVHDIYEWIAN